MFQLRRLSIIFCILSCMLQAQGADKYTDENRPYEFGFNIDGEQHRHEKKDENGIIMGEFGFITADGVYHVTVYATDENGNFKILSMKNIRVKPYPTAPMKKGHSLPFPPSDQKPVVQGPTPQPQQPVSLEPPARSCSHCSLPTTKAPVLTDIAVVSRDDIPQNSQNAQNPQNPAYPQNPQYPQNPENPQNAQNPQYPAPGSQNYPQQPGAQEQPGTQGQAGSPQYPGQGSQPGDRNPKQYDPQAPSKPTLISAQMQIVDKNTDVNQRGPGEKEGLPDGLTKNDMKLLLYTFNYTVGFHGHHEEGYTDGSKIGYYYVTGRNGVRTRVDYVADEKGFRPKITQEVLDLLSEDVPKPETEKDEKYGLKGYEFKWIYYPADSRRR